MKKMFITLSAVFVVICSTHVSAMEEEQPATIQDLRKQLLVKEKQLQDTLARKQYNQKELHKAEDVSGLFLESPEVQAAHKESLNMYTTNARNYETQEQTLRTEIKTLRDQIEEANTKEEDDVRDRQDDDLQELGHYREDQTVQRPVVKFISKYRSVFAGVIPAVTAAFIAYLADRKAQQYKAHKAQPSQDSFDAQLIALNTWLNEHKVEAVATVATCCMLAAVMADLACNDSYFWPRSDNAIN